MKERKKQKRTKNKARKDSWTTAMFRCRATKRINQHNSKSIDGLVVLCSTSLSTFMQNHHVQHKKHQE